MSRVWRVSAVLATAAICGLAVTWLCGADEQGPTPEIIAAGLRSQVAGCGRSLDVKYIYEHETGGSGGFEIRYVRTPDIQLMEVNDGKGYRELDRFDATTGEFRQLTVAAGHSVGLIGRGLWGNGTLGTQTRHDPIVRGLAGKPLADAVAEGTVLGEEIVDGRRCWKLEVPPGEGETAYVKRHVLWLDPNIGFCPRRIAMELKEEGKDPQIVEFSDYEELADGVWFPYTITYRTRVGQGDNCQPESTVIKSRVREVSIDSPIAPDDLSVAFPSGTEVRDEVLDAEYTVP